MLDSKVKELLPDIIKDAMEVLTETANATDEIKNHPNRKSRRTLRLVKC